MAIGPIGVSFRNNYNISFESRKENKNKNYDKSASSPVKAVPLAVLLAMSPLNVVDAKYYGNDLLPDIENVSGINGVRGEGNEIEELVFNDKIAQGKVKEIVRLVDTDGNTNTAEKIELDIHRHNYTNYIRNPKIIIVKIGAASPDYYAYGSGYKRKAASGLVFEKEHIFQKLGSDELVEYLKGFSNDKKRNNGALSGKFILIDNERDYNLMNTGLINDLSPRLREELLK